MPEAALTKDQIIAGILRLSLDDQLDVFDVVRETLAVPELPSRYDIEVTDELMAELDRRVDRMRKDSSSSVSWDEVQRKMRQQLGGKK